VWSRAGGPRFLIRFVSRHSPRFKLAGDSSFHSVLLSVVLEDPPAIGVGLTKGGREERVVDLWSRSPERPSCSRRRVMISAFFPFSDIPRALHEVFWQWSSLECPTPRYLSFCRSRPACGPFELKYKSGRILG
jgi:hypothetical protein